MTGIFGKFSCLYFLIFEERKNSYIVKFGMTDDLNRRMNEHSKEFGNVFIKFCRYIDETELNNAEQELHTFFNKNYTPVKKWPENGTQTSEKNRKEIFEIKKGEVINSIKKIYDEIAIKYGKKVIELNKIAKTTENNNAQKLVMIENDYKLNIMEKDCEIKTLKKDIEIYKTNIENLNLKLEMSALKLSIYTK
jgi:predicted GIY-YIG superfamily endonuclease